MTEIIMDALIDTSKMIPLLLLIYIGIEFLEYKFGAVIGEKVKRAGKVGPILGAGFGCIPQCGFSVISTTLYSKRLISVGTLLAVYLSTSDEAIPVILSQPDKIGVILPLLLTKVGIAIVAGFSIDGLIHWRNKHSTQSQICATSQDGTLDEHDVNMKEIEETGCCGHHCTSEKINLKELFLHPMIHTAKVFFFIFAVTILLNLFIYYIGEENIGRLFMGNTIFQPIIAAFIGLIPNCAASVAITQLFLNGAIGFGSTIAGLSASAGLGMIVLFKENKDRKDTLKIVGILLTVSILSGIFLQFFLG